jgi:hypothetical protein
VAVTPMDGRASRVSWVCVEVWRLRDERGTVGELRVTPIGWEGSRGRRGGPGRRTCEMGGPCLGIGRRACLMGWEPWWVW